MLLFFSETIVVYNLKLATDYRSDKKFLLTPKLYPLVAVRPLPRDYIHVLNYEKMYKIRLQRDFFETCNKWVKDKAFLFTSKLCPQGGAVCPCPGAIYMYKIKKKCIKSKFKEIFETCNK